MKKLATAVLIAAMAMSVPMSVNAKNNHKATDNLAIFIFGAIVGDQISKNNRRNRNDGHWVTRKGHYETYQGTCTQVNPVTDRVWIRGHYNMNHYYISGHWEYFQTDNTISYTCSKRRWVNASRVWVR